MITPTSSTTDHLMGPRPILDRAIATSGVVIVGVRTAKIRSADPDATEQDWLDVLAIRLDSA
jgi:hypothetical protein